MAYGSSVLATSYMVCILLLDHLTYSAPSNVWTLSLTAYLLIPRIGLGVTSMDGIVYVARPAYNSSGQSVLRGESPWLSLFDSSKLYRTRPS